MKAKTTKSRNVIDPQLPSSGGPATLTRSDVAKALRCSISTVRRLEGVELHPTEDADGVHRFDPLEVIHLVNDRSARAVDPSKEGERDARVFEMMDAGKGVREIVTTLRLPVEVVLKLSDQWRGGWSTRPRRPARLQGRARAMPGECQGCRRAHSTGGIARSRTRATRVREREDVEPHGTRHRHCQRNCVKKLRHGKVASRSEERA